MGSRGRATAATAVESNAAVWFLAPADRLWQGLLTEASLDSETDLPDELPCSRVFLVGDSTCRRG